MHYQFLKTDAEMWTTKNFDDAIFRFNQILLQSKNDMNIYVILTTCELGVVYSLKKDQKKSFFYFTQVAKMIKQIDFAKSLFWSLLILDNLAKFYSNQHQNTQCIEILNQAISLIKKYGSFFADSFYFVYAEALDEQGKMKEAIKYMVQAWSLSPFLTDKLVQKNAEKFLVNHGINFF